MKKPTMKLWTTLMLLVLLFAQFGVKAEEDIKVKIKKGEIQINEEPVAKIDGKSGNFTILDLNGEAKFNVNIVYEEITPLHKFTSCNITSLDGSKVSSMPFKGVSLTLSNKKVVAESLILGVNLISKSGIDDAKVTEYIDAQKEVTYTPKIQLAKDAQGTLKKSGISINEKREIVQDGTIIGVYSKKKVGERDYIYKFYNRKRVLVAEYQSASSLINFTKGEECYVPYTREAPETAYFILETIVYKGYTFEYKEAQTKEMPKQLVDRFGNIKDAPGYVIDEDGIKYEGKVSITFFDASPSGIKSLNKAGKTVGVWYEDNSKKKTKIRLNNVTASEGWFAILDGDTEVKYIGTKEVSSSGYLFYKVIAENNGTYIIQSQGNNKRYAIKTASSNEAKKFIAKTDRSIVKMKEYLNCPHTDAMVEECDFKTLESITALYNSYIEGCK